MDLQRTLLPKHEGYSFGSGDPKLLGDELIRLGEDIKAGRAHSTRVKLIQSARQEDFYQQTLIVGFFEKVHPVTDLPSIPG